MRRVLVTIIVGEMYQKGFEKNVYPGWRNYAIKWGYDIVVIDSPIDTSERARNRSIAWQKCLIFEYPLLSSYDRIVWLDADILINPEAPDILSDVPPESVGAVAEVFGQSPLQGVEHEAEREGRRKFHTDFGLPGTFDTIVQTGVLLLSREHHPGTLRHVCDHWEDRGGDPWNYEMRPLSYELQAGHPIQWLDPRFNMLWVNVRENFYPFLEQGKLADSWKILEPMTSVAQILLVHECIRACLQGSYFLHFAGTKFYELPFVDPGHVRDVALSLMARIRDGQHKPHPQP